PPSGDRGRPRRSRRSKDPPAARRRAVPGSAVAARGVDGTYRRNTMTAIWTRTRVILEMIKFEHTIFALPFALISVLLAARPHLLPPGLTLVWILLAMVGARSAAMAFNRVADAEIDAQNPRTANRHIPAG